jgi:UDP-glucose 4-epimerase
VAILVTGGAGYIGSHTCVELLAHDYDVLVVDNYSNSSPAVIDVVRSLGGDRIAAADVDLRDRHRLDQVFDENKVDAVIHFAAKKSVPESVRIPAEYFDNNVAGTINLLRSMLDHGVEQMVFSSSCSVYGDQYSEPISEGDPPAPANPYARSKLMAEQILADTCATYDELSVLALRYFNPTAAHPSGMLGEDPVGVPGNLMPYLTGVAAGSLDQLTVYGADYPTRDGSAVRDYVHVMDVAEAHRLGLQHAGEGTGMRVLNLGTGLGVSVLEFVAAFERACDVRVPLRIAGRRPGDVASLVADPGLADQEWGWRATRDLRSMCRDAWRFQQRQRAS